MHVILLALVGCDHTGPVGEGIAVGNPGSLTIQTSRSSEAPLSAADAIIEELSLQDCAGNPVALATGIGLALDGSSSLAVPAGEWCGVSLSFDGPAAFSYEVDDGTLALELELGTVSVDSAAFGVDGDPLVMQLGPPDLIDPAQWDITAGETLNIDSAVVEHDELTSAIADWLVLGRDDDGDGVIDSSDTLYGASEAAASDLAEKEESGDDDNEDDDDD